MFLYFWQGEYTVKNQKDKQNNVLYENIEVGENLYHDLRRASNQYIQYKYIFKMKLMYVIY